MYVKKLNWLNQIISFKQNALKLIQVHVEKNKSEIKP